MLSGDCDVMVVVCCALCVVRRLMFVGSCISCGVYYLVDCCLLAVI